LEKEGEQEEDVALLGETHLEEEIESVLQPPPPQRRETKRINLTLASTLAPTPSTLAPTIAPSTLGSAPTPAPIASKGRVVTFACKRGRGNRRFISAFIIVVSRCLMMSYLMRYIYYCFDANLYHAVKT
jgi:hypothetical protein